MTVDMKGMVDTWILLWTLKNEAHPKTKSVWLDVVDGSVVFDPEKVTERLENAKKILQEAKAKKENILVVCEKMMYSDELAELCNANGIFFLNQKVPSGFLSNFDTFMKRVEKMNSMRTFMESESFKALTKKEQVIHKRNYNKVNRLYSGVKNLKWKPSLVIVVDGNMLEGFVKELELQKDVNRIVLCSSNFWDYLWKNDVVWNMLSYKSLDFIMKYILS